MNRFSNRYKVEWLTGTYNNKVLIPLSTQTQKDFYHCTSLIIILQTDEEKN